MARSFIPILLLAILGVAAGFFKAATPHQEAAVPAPTTLSAFDEGLDNANIASDMNISPARKCGFCMGVSSLNHSKLVCMA